jgi:hypothetical protein
MDNKAWIDLTITRGPIRGRDRNRIGLIVHVQTRRDVEEFISSLANGRTIGVDAYADTWQNCGLQEKPLETYEIENELPNEQRPYSLFHIGLPLIVNKPDRVRVGDGSEMVNLSILRLVGIGESDGVKVGIVGAYSADYVKRVRNLLPNAIKQFLQDYLVPITVNLQIVSKGD